MSDHIRVRVVGPDHECTIGQDQYDAQPEAFEVLKKPAVDGGGADLPPKYKTSVSEEAAKNKAASPAAEKADSTASTKEK